MQSGARFKLIAQFSLDLREIPAEVFQLQRLQELDLGGNQLATIPESIGQLKNLQQLWISNYQLAALPESIGQLRGLKYFSVPKSLRQEMESMHGQV